MNKLYHLLAAFIFCHIIHPLYAQNTTFAPLKLQYNKSASNFTEALPIGNGSLGAMVYGGWESEKLILNDNTLWSGNPREWNNTNAGFLFPVMKTELKNNDFKEAEMVWEKMQGPYPECYLPMATLNINMQHNGVAQNYYRELDIDSALCKINYQIGSTEFTREIFSSHPAKSIIIKLKASEKEKISFVLSLSSQLKYTTQTENNVLVLQGKAPAHIAQSDVDTAQIVYNQTGGMTFNVRAKAIATGGQTIVDNAHIIVNKADDVLIFITSGTSFNGADKHPVVEGKNPAAESRFNMRTASSQRYNQLKSNHISDYQLLYKRFALKIGENLTTNQTTDRLIATNSLMQQNKTQLLPVLYAQYGRYLLISSSRNGGRAVPPTGLWNNNLVAYKGGNYRFNLASQMMYWAAENTQLNESHKPLFDFIETLVKNGSTTAKVNYDAKGWLVHSYSDIWGQTAPAGQFELEAKNVSSQTAWLFGGLWLSKHLWDAYLYNGDKTFLATIAYPAMKSAVQFATHCMMQNQKNQWLTAPSISPDNKFKDANGNILAIGKASALDMALVYEHFNYCIEAAKQLKTDAKFRTELQMILRKLHPFVIKYNGTVKQWYGAVEPLNQKSDFIPHLYGVYPGNCISITENKELAEAAYKTLELSETGNTSWAKVWRIATYARLNKAEKAKKILDQLMLPFSATSGLFPNMLNGSPYFDVAANAGATAAITEMLLQSHNGEVHLLPALPAEWNSGSVCGIKTRGGFEFDINWENGQLTNGELRSPLGGVCRIRTSTPILIDGYKPGKAGYFSRNHLLNKLPAVDVTSEFKGESTDLKINGKYVYEIDTRKNGVYKISTK